jgi:hypothetical protein
MANLLLGHLAGQFIKVRVRSSRKQFDTGVGLKFRLTLQHFKSCHCKRFCFQKYRLMKFVLPYLFVVRTFLIIPFKLNCLEIIQFRYGKTMEPYFTSGCIVQLLVVSGQIWQSSCKLRNLQAGIFISQYVATGSNEENKVLFVDALYVHM